MDDGEPAAGDGLHIEPCDCKELAAQHGEVNPCGIDKVRNAITRRYGEPPFIHGTLITI